MINELKLKNTSEYKTISVGETLTLMETSPDGLTTPEARRRLGIFGFNEA